MTELIEKRIDALRRNRGTVSTQEHRVILEVILFTKRSVMDAEILQATEYSGLTEFLRGTQKL